MTDTPSVEVRDNPDQHRYEILVDGVVAGHARYRRESGVVVFIHTEVDDQYAGQGLGRRLARAALEDVGERGLRVTPLCPFIARFIHNNPEYQDLLTTRNVTTP